MSPIRDKMPWENKVIDINTKRKMQNHREEIKIIYNKVEDAKRKLEWAKNKFNLALEEEEINESIFYLNKFEKELQEQKKKASIRLDEILLE
jgi:hypothetical protein